MSQLSSRMWRNLFLFEKRMRTMLSLSAIALISILFTISAVCFVQFAIHRSSTIVISFATVTQSLIEKGLTDKYFAQLLADHLDSIKKSSGTGWLGRFGYVADLSSDITNLSFEVGGSGFTLSVALSALYDFFGVREQRAIGYVVEAQDSAYFRIRLTSASKTYVVEKRIPISQLVSGGQVSHDLAEQIMGVLDAFTLASYKFQFDLDSSRQIAEGCLSDEWRDNDSWALNLLGIIEFTKENYEVAVSFYHRAFRANPQFLSAILNLANAFAESGQCDSSEFYYLRASNIGYKDKANLFGN